jgi:uncharacterized repeat protein (TIGR03803 family)
MLKIPSAMLATVVYLAQAVVTANAQIQPTTEFVLHSFGGARGMYPLDRLTADSAGFIYGTANQGGTADKGVVFALDPAHRESVVHDFQGGTDGSNPTNGVTRDPVGNLYGVTYSGGTSNQGVVYEIGLQGTETILHTFTGGADGGNPSCELVRDDAGNFYGTTKAGGSGGAGVVFQLDAAGNQSVLYSFTGGADGGAPLTGLVRDTNGNLYGTASRGGAYEAGVVFKIDAAGTETVLHSFGNAADGRSPIESLVLAPAHELYGTTPTGGQRNGGIVFRLDVNGNNYQVLYNFANGSSPNGVIRDSGGNLYGTALGSPSASGFIFKYDNTGHYTQIHVFNGQDGRFPSANLFLDAAGDLFGTTRFGGPSPMGTIGNGEVFKLDTSGKLTVIFDFLEQKHGDSPLGNVVRDAAGNLYGTTYYGGGLGTVFRVDASGNLSVLHKFTGSPDGDEPIGNIALDTAGNIYGTTYQGGANKVGMVFRVDPSGNETILHSFNSGADGALPYGGVIVDSAGNVYGATTTGGVGGSGVVYKIDSTGNETLLYSFTGGAAGGSPYGCLFLDAAGDLYGTTQGGGEFDSGVVFKVRAARQGLNTYQVLYSLPSSYAGQPQTGVILDQAGNIYGTNIYGNVYMLDPAGNETTLYSFSGTDQGNYPSALVMDAAGNLYGTVRTYNNYGIVFQLRATGQMTELYKFDNGPGGGQPFSGVIMDGAGNLYGTASQGGVGGYGVVFKLTKTSR